MSFSCSDMTRVASWLHCHWLCAVPAVRRARFPERSDARSVPSRSRAEPRTHPVRASGAEGCGKVLRSGPSLHEVRMVEETAAPLRNASSSRGNSESLSFPWTLALLASVLITTIVVDVLGNLLVIVSVFRNRKLRKTGNAFVVSLAVADLVVAIYPYPMVLTAIFNNGWIAGNIQCQISGFLMGISVISSIFNITVIAINRYCYICHSLNYDKIFSKKNTVCYMVLVWVFTILAITPNWFVESLQYDARVYSCTFAQSVSSLYTIMVVVVHFILPISIVTYCYLRIWILVIQVRKRAKPDNQLKIKPHVFRNFLTMFVVFVLFAVCWAPLNLIGLAVAIQPTLGQAIPVWLFTASYFMAYFNSCLNAVIYGLLNNNFRKEYKRIVLHLFKFHC